MSRATGEKASKVIESLVEDLSVGRDFDHDGDTGLVTGVRSLDDALGPLEPGRLCLVAARPSTGRTALLYAVALANATRDGAAVTLATALATTEESGLRLLAAAAEVPLAALRYGEIGEADWDSIYTAMRRLQTAALTLECSAEMTFSDVLGRFREHTRNRRLRLLLVDDLHAWRGLPPPRAHEGPLDTAVLLLKRFAMAQNAFVMATVPLLRRVDGRADLRPRLSDLWGTTVAECVADEVVLLRRLGLYHREAPNRDVDFLLGRRGRGAMVTSDLYLDPSGRLRDRRQSDADDRGRMIVLPNDYLPPPPPLPPSDDDVDYC